MQVFRSKVNVTVPDFKANHDGLLAMCNQLQERLKLSLDQGPAPLVARHVKGGKLLARDRVELLLDQDSPFLELMPLAGWEQDAALGGSIVAGIGLVSGVECLVSASVPTIKGGAVNEVTLAKTARLAQIAMENCLPSISLIQSAGADLSQQEKVFHMGGATFRELARRSKRGLTNVCVVFGSSTAGGAYQAGMSDYCIMVRNAAKVFLGGPPLVKMATGEVSDDETLGGAEMHAKTSGLADYMVEDELQAVHKARQVIAQLGWRKSTPLPAEHVLGAVDEPLYAASELLGIVGPNIRVPFDAREVIARLVDGSRMADFKPLYGSTLVTCFAKIHGIEVGILANNGVLFSEAAQKGTQFIHLCNQRDIPLVYLQNITGFMVGKQAEQRGIIKHGAQLINAVSNSGVPAITLVIGASYGAGNYAMCGRAYQPRFLFSWPNSRCSVMGPEQLTGVMDIVMREGAAKAGRTVDETAAAARKELFAKQLEDTSDVYYTSSRMIDDGIIDPRDSRAVLGLCLSVVHSAPLRGANTFGISRM